MDVRKVKLLVERIEVLEGQRKELDSRLVESKDELRKVVGTVVGPHQIDASMVGGSELARRVAGKSKRKGRPSDPGSLRSRVLGFVKSHPGATRRLVYRAFRGEGKVRVDSTINNLLTANELKSRTGTRRGHNGQLVKVLSVNGNLVR